ARPQGGRSGARIRERRVPSTCPCRSPGHGGGGLRGGAPTRRACTGRRPV
ncbi:MAG: hypothetical protein AVDCRST_MAG19-303, partial [uncultured Thermomicrobiales bacterium]